MRQYFEEFFTLARKSTAGTIQQIGVRKSCNTPCTKATLTPKNDLVRGATYEATVTKAARDLAGNAFDQKPGIPSKQSMVWRFTVR